MKNYLKLSVLAVAIAFSFAACKGKSTTGAADSAKTADSLKAADSAKTKLDTLKKDTAKAGAAAKDTTKKK